jgi:hypothetical protein
MCAVPALTAETTPVIGCIVAAEPIADQLPPAGDDNKELKEPEQTVVAPDIEVGVAFTVTLLTV